MKTIADLSALLWGINPTKAGGRMAGFYGRTGKHAKGHAGQAYKARHRRRAGRRTGRR